MQHSVTLFGGPSRAWYDVGTEMVEVGDRLVPALIWVDVQGNANEPNLGMKIEVRQGAPVYTQVTLLARPDGPDIRDKDLKDIYLNDWLEQIVAAFSFRLDGTKEVDRRAAVTNARRTRTGRPRVSQEQLQRVATIYRDHIDERPTDAVRRAFGVSERTAARYVELCRSDEYQLLPKTTPGKRKA